MAVAYGSTLSKTHELSVNLLLNVHEAASVKDPWKAPIQKFIQKYLLNMILENLRSVSLDEDNAPNINHKQTGFLSKSQERFRYKISTKLSHDTMFILFSYKIYFR